MISPLLLRLLTRLGQVRVKEHYIHGLHGQTDGKTIEINPIPAVVDTVIHELLHAERPDLSESQVRRLTTRLFNQLEEGEMRTIYDIYRSRVERR